MGSPDTSALLSVSFYDDHYLQCQQEFEKATSWLPDYRKWVKTHLGPKVLEKLDITLPEGGQLKVLGIGSGEGEVEYQLLTSILPKYPKIHNTVVDPSKTQLDLYKNLIERKQPELDDVEYHWRLQMLGEYRLTSEESGDKTKFHFISALFCLYYEPDMDLSLSYLYSRLEPGGVLLLGMETERCDVMKIEKHFQFGQDDLIPFYCFRDMAAFFKKRGVPFEIVNQPEDQTDFDVTACFDESSREGALLLDFLSSVANFREVASPVVFKEFLDFVRNLATIRDGKVLLYYDTDYILVNNSKNQNHFI